MTATDAAAGVRSTDHDGVRVISFNRPPVNAIDLPTVRAFQERVVEAAESASCLAVVLTGEGTAFNAGIDHRVVPTYDADARAEMISTINATLCALYGMAKPTVAAINGHALGGGLVVALACDVRIAADAGQRLGLAEVTAGIPFPAVPLVITRAELDPSSARTLVLSGALFGPRDPIAERVLDAVVPPDALLETAIAIAAERAALASYGVVKRQLREAARREIDRIVEERADPLLQHWF